MSFSTTTSLWGRRLAIPTVVPRGACFSAMNRTDGSRKRARCSARWRSVSLAAILSFDPVTSARAHSTEAAALPAPPPKTVPEADKPPAAPSLSTAGARTCTLTSLRGVATDVSNRFFSIALGGDRRGVILAWSPASDQVKTMPLSSAGESQGPVHTMEMPGARAIEELHRWDDQHYVLIADGLNPSGNAGLKGLTGQLLDQAGAAVGTWVRHSTEEEVTWYQSAKIERGQYILYRTTYIRPSLLLLDQDDGGKLRLLGVKSFGACDKGVRRGASNWGYLSLTTYAGKWNILRPRNEEFHEIQEAALCSADQAAPIKGLPRIMSIDDFRVNEHGAVVLYTEIIQAPDSDEGTLSQDRTLFHIGFDGKPQARAQRIGPGQPLPTPFLSDAITWKVEEESPHNHVWQLVRTGSRGPIGAKVFLGRLKEGPREEGRAMGIWVDDHFLIATSSYEGKVWRIDLHSVRCARPSN